jgi:hypothetical protein
MHDKSQIRLLYMYKSKIAEYKYILFLYILLNDKKLYPYQKFENLICCILKNSYISILNIASESLGLILGQLHMWV